MTQSTMSTRSILTTISPSSFRTLLSAKNSRVIPVDATWYMPNNPKDGKQEFLHQERISDSAFFDLDEVSLPDTKYPHTLPTFEKFNQCVKNLGILKDDVLVVYDKSGIFSSPRAAWTFALFGHPKVYLLDNYVNYRESEYPISTGAVETFATPLANETPEYFPITKEEYLNNYANQVIEYEELLGLLDNGRLSQDYVTFDARPNDRFTGKAPEPRPGLSSGHIPGALSLPFSKVLNAQDKRYKSKDELLEIFKSDFGLDLSNSDFLKDKKGIIVMCGSGVTAVVLRFAIESILGLKVPIRVYDGSWTEWADRAPEKYIEKS